MTKYFNHLIKKNIIPFVCFTIFFVLVYVLPIWTKNYEYEKIYSHHLNLDSLSLPLSFVAMLIPIYIFSYKMNKRSVDMNYSLPITRRKILIAHFLVGLIIMYASYSIAYWLGFFAIIIKIKELYKIYYLYLYLATIFPIFIIYSFTAFIYTRANTIVDGVISVICALLLPSMIVLTLSYLCPGVYSSGTRAGQFLYFQPLIEIVMLFRHAIVGEKYIGLGCSEYASMIIWAVLAVAASVGLFASEKYYKAENCGQISESIFCYKLQIPTYTVLLVSVVMSTLKDGALICMTIFVEFVMCIIYKRTIKIGWKFAAVFVASIIIGILLSVIATAIFGSVQFRH